MPKVLVDGQSIEVNEGENLLEACLNAGLDLPYFCWHPAMGSVGSCRQCAVVQYQSEEDTTGRIVMGCMTQVKDGARFSLDTENATQFREAIIESLMLNHPHDCPVCSEGGECHLQDMTVMVGHRDRRYTGKKNTHRNQYLGPLIHHEMNRCITCYRCERFYKDYAGGKDFGAQASRDRVFFGRQKDGILESEFSGNLVEVCPTGVFTDKPFLAKFSRKWDLQSAPSICFGCAVGCNTAPGERYGQLKRIHNRYNYDVNGYFICDRGRFGAGYVNNAERIDFAGLREVEGSFSAIRQDNALSTAARWLNNKRVVGIGSPRASLEPNFLLKHWLGPTNFSSGLSDSEASAIEKLTKILSSTTANVPSVRQMESADAILILGEDVSNTAPRIALALRQAVRNESFSMAEAAGIPKWQDAAVRNLGQDELSPLVVVTSSESRLDDVASHIYCLNPDEIADFGFSLAEKLNGGEIEDEMVCTAADILLQANRPLVVSGISGSHPDILSSAAMVADTLSMSNKDTMLSLCVPESNSMGAALLRDQNTLSLTEVIEQLDKIDTLVILENDLSRRLGKSALQKLADSKVDIISLDVLENDTLNLSSMVLPAASFAESEGTLINFEGRAQRYFPVFEPANERLPSWQWLVKLASLDSEKKLSGLDCFDDVVSLLASSDEKWSEIDKVAPGQAFRDRGQKIPRQTHRYSGRTAMNASVSVHEPPQPKDNETALAYSMEGLNRDQPSTLSPFVWSPGWNSNHSVQKFQSKVDGPHKNPTPDVMLISSDREGFSTAVKSHKSNGAKKDKWTLIPIACIHGSEELSSHTKEISELAGNAFVALTEAGANALNVSDGDGLLVIDDIDERSLEVRIVDRMADGCVGFSVGFEETLQLIPGHSVQLTKDANWVRSKPLLIATDGASEASFGENLYG